MPALASSCEGRTADMARRGAQSRDATELGTRRIIRRVQRHIWGRRTWPHAGLPGPVYSSSWPRKSSTRSHDAHFQTEPLPNFRGSYCKPRPARTQNARSGRHIASAEGQSPLRTSNGGMCEQTPECVYRSWPIAGTVGDRAAVPEHDGRDVATGAVGRLPETQRRRRR